MEDKLGKLVSGILSRTNFHWAEFMYRNEKKNVQETLGKEARHREVGDKSCSLVCLDTVQQKANVRWGQGVHKWEVA
jgi:hypothetical protein